VRYGAAEEGTAWRGMPTRVPVTAQPGIKSGRRVLDGGHDVYRLEGTSRPATIKRRVFGVNSGSLNTVADHNISLQVPDHCQASPPTSGSLHPASSALTCTRRGREKGGLPCIWSITESG
jgi:hypothetical protein